jgi:hypothetical protein
MATFHALQEKDALIVVVNGRRALELGWTSGRELCTLMGAQLREPAPAVETSLRVGPAHVAFRRQPRLDDEREDMLLCILNGVLLFDAPLSVARQIWTLLTGAQRLAEEWAHAEQVAADAGLLLRTGAPIGLTDHPKIQEESIKVARDDRTLRRALPGGVKSTVVLGAPRIFHDQRPAADRLAALFARSDQANRQRILAKLA